MSNRNSSTMTLPAQRTVIGGRVESVDGQDVYVIVLDGNQEVETKDYDLARSLSGANRAGRKVTVDLDETAAGRPTVTSAQVLAEPGAQPQPPSTPAAATSQALMKAPAIPQHLIVRPDELAAQMAALEQHYNVLSPAIQISQIAEGYGANLAVVRIDPSVTFDDKKESGSGSDCYWSRSLLKDPNKRALNKQGLLKISQAAGIQWVPTECRRTDDGKERNLWSWKYFGYVRTHDGQLQPVSGSRELDLRDGAAEAAAMTSNQLAKARAMGNQICEQKAMQRAIRSIGIRQAYTVDELKKPFLIVRFSFTPDMRDPEIKKLVTENAMKGIGALYSPPPAPALPLPSEDEPQPSQETSAPASSTSATAPAPAKPKADPFADPPATNGPATPTLPADAVFVAKVEKFTGTNPKTKKPWTRYDVTFSNGQIASTFSDTQHQIVDEAAKHKLPLRVTTSEVEGYNDKIDTLSIIDTRQGSLPIGEKPKL